MERLLIIDPRDLLHLLTHYTDGAVPIDAELQFLGVSQYHQRMIGMWVRSGGWPDQAALPGPDGGYYPLHIRYEGKKTLAWEGPRASGDPTWTPSLEAPNRQ